MSEIEPPRDNLSACVQEVADLTYFAFAKPAAIARDDVSNQARSAELPDVLAGRYRIERLLGAGGMGAVYRAKDLLREQFGDPEPYVALKLLGEELTDSPDASALLYSEFALARRLHHPNVLRMHNFEVDTRCGRAFITMELMHGLTLDRLLCERPLGLSWPELRDIVLPLLDALAYVHSRGVLHGDVKPSNVMIGEEGVRLFDFGLGVAEEGLLSELPRLRRSRFNAWTPGYAAPELLDGAPLAASADVFSAACVIYEMACGKHPLRRMASTQARDERLHLELKAPRTLPRSSWSALRTALALDPKDRNLTAAQLRDALSGRSFFWVKRG